MLPWSHQQVGAWGGAGVVEPRVYFHSRRRAVLRPSATPLLSQRSHGSCLQRVHQRPLQFWLGFVSQAIPTQARSVMQNPI